MPETIWIIGASDGIGAALARDFARQGARLILSARSEDRLDKMVMELGPERHIALPVDVADRTCVETAVSAITKLGQVDRVIHMAAAYDPGRIGEVDPDKAAKIVDINLTGSFHIARLAPSVLKPGGQLAMCGSVAGYVGLPQGQIYSATKAGVINLVESLKVELAGQVDVRLISPGFVDTRLTQRNEFTMPAMVTPQRAAAEIVKGLNRNRFEIHFPRRLTMTLKLLRVLPYWIVLPLTQRLVR